LPKNSTGLGVTGDQDGGEGHSPPQLSDVWHSGILVVFLNIMDTTASREGGAMLPLGDRKLEKQWTDKVASGAPHAPVNSHVTRVYIHDA